MSVIDKAIRDLQEVISLLQGIDCKTQSVPRLGSQQKDYPVQFYHSDWDCKESPTGCCMYTYYSTYDSCIFCGDPDERK
jgi:hypothetical protein